MSIIFKACRRCAGDLYLEEDTDGEYLTCLRWALHHKYLLNQKSCG